MSPSDFALPQQTPFDQDAALRDKYIDGFHDGIRQGLHSLRDGQWHTGDVFVESLEEDAYARGWRDAAIMLLDHAETNGIGHSRGAVGSP